MKLSGSLRLTLAGCCLALFPLLFSCQDNKEVADRELPDMASVSEAFAESNKQLVAMEEQAIDDFIARFGWDMEKTGSGLRYMIEDEGSSPKASYGRQAVINYEKYLITGDPVGSSDEEGPKKFTVGRGGVISGLEEGILLLGEGGKATFVMPSFLAYGVPGDGEQIPGRATLIYRVDVLEIN